MQKIPPIRFLKADEMIQRIMLILIGVTLVLYPIAMLLAIPFGAWQVLSGIVGAIYGSVWRMKYLVFVFIYFMTMPITIMFENHPISDVIEPILIGFYFITPIVLGIYYYYKTRRDIPKEDSKENWNPEEILDAEFVNEVA